MKVLVSALWVAAGVFAVAEGLWVALLVIVAYLAYLWLFDGKWLLY
jgi:hypothetical protein